MHCFKYFIVSIVTASPCRILLSFFGIVVAKKYLIFTKKKKKVLLFNKQNLSLLIVKVSVRRKKESPLWESHQDRIHCAFQFLSAT